MMPFSGVRSSWEMLARKRLLASVAERAASRARPNCSFLMRSSMAYCSTLRAVMAARFRSVTSSRERQTPVTSTLIVADQVFADFDGDAGAIVQHVIALEWAGLLPGCDAVEHGGTELVLLIGSDEIPGVAAQHLVRSAFQQGADGLVETA